MVHAPTTRSSLLVRLRDARDEQAWGHFVRLYGPLIYHYARRRGLQDSDAADVTQEVLRAVLGGADRLDQIHRRGSLRAWLFTVAHHKVFDLLRRGERPGQGTGEGDEALDDRPAPEEEAAWEREYREQLLARAADEVRTRCSPTAWEAFQRTAVEGQEAAAVAQALGLNVAAVYLAKSRIMARLREQVRQWEEEDSVVYFNVERS